MTKKCKHCKNNLKKVLDLPSIPLANSFEKKAKKKYKLVLGICTDCKLFQQVFIPTKKNIFNNDYPYLTSKSIKNKIFFRKIKKKISLKKNQFIIDIGCNDGTFLQNFNSKKFKHLGIDPSRIATNLAKKNGIKVYNNFFDLNLSKKILKQHGQADVIFSSNTLAHVENINQILKGISLLLKKDGTLYVQNIYLYDLVKKIYFDQIYHEHIFTYSIESLNNVFQKYGLYLNKVEFNDIQGGSFLAKFTKIKTNKKSVLNIIKDEQKKSLLIKTNQTRFRNSIKEKIKKFKLMITKKIKNKYTISGYGASAKCVMMLNLLKLNASHIKYVVDNTKKKQNKLIPGTNIPIISPKNFIKKKTDICVIFTWNYAQEIIKKTKQKINWVILK